MDPRARATLENLVTGSRIEEIAVIRANLGKAQSDLALAQSNLTRSEKLLATGTVAAVQVEQDRTSLASATAQVAQLTAQVRVAELPARSAQQVAAEANLAAAEADTCWHTDLAYFPYLDSYLRFLPVPMVPRLLLNRPWSGLYLRNHHHGEPPSAKKSLRLLAKGDAILRSHQCRGIGVLDERFIHAMENSYGVGVTAYPDVTQADLPAEPSSLAREVTRKAAGRTIVGIIGLERRKGFLTLLQVAEIARNARLPFYFVCAGNFISQQFSAAERAGLVKLAARSASGEIDNLHFDPAASRIPTEADYNSLFHTFGIAWAAYEGFQGSSGTLGKAAAFEIPCLATSGECIGQRVESYRLGITIREGHAGDAAAALPFLAAGTDTAGNPLAARFSAYRDDHSSTRLDEILAALLASL